MTKPKVPEGWFSVREDYVNARKKMTTKLIGEIDRLSEIFEFDSSLSSVPAVQVAIRRLNKAAGSNKPSSKETQSSSSFDWRKLGEVMESNGITSKKMGVGKRTLEKLFFGNTAQRFEHNKWNNREQKESVLDYDPNSSNKLRRYWLKRSWRSGCWES